MDKESTMAKKSEGMTEHARKVTLTQAECLTIIAACKAPASTSLVGAAWSFLLGMILGDAGLLKVQSAVAAALDEKNVGEGHAPKKAQTLVNQWKAYVKARAELHNKHGKKLNGVLVTVQPNQLLPPQYVMEDQAAFEKDHEPLEDKYKGAIAARNAQVERVNEMLTNETTLELPIIRRGDLPEGVTPEVIAPLGKLLGVG